MGKIFESIEDKHKTHDELLYGIEAMKAKKSNSSTAQQAPLSLVSISPPTPTKPVPKLSPEQQKSQEFLNKLNSYSVKPSYTPNLLHTDDDDEVSLLDHSLPSTNPFDKVSDKGKLFDTHNQIIQLQDQIIKNHEKNLDFGLVQWQDDVDQ